MFIPTRNLQAIDPGGLRRLRPVSAEIRPSEMSDWRHTVDALDLASNDPRAHSQCFPAQQELHELCLAYTGRRLNDGQIFDARTHVKVASTLLHHAVTGAWRIDSFRNDAIFVCLLPHTLPGAGAIRAQHRVADAALNLLTTVTEKNQPLRKLRTTTSPSVHRLTEVLAQTLSSDIYAPAMKQRIAAALERTIHTTDADISARSLRKLIAQESKQCIVTTPDSEAASVTVNYAEDADWARGLPARLMAKPDLLTLHAKDERDFLATRVLNAEPEWLTYMRLSEDTESAASIRALAQAIAKPHIKEAFLTIAQPEYEPPERLDYMIVLVPPHIATIEDPATQALLNSFVQECVHRLDDDSLADYTTVNTRKFGNAQRALAANPRNHKAAEAIPLFNSAKNIYRAELLRRGLLEQFDGA